MQELYALEDLVADFVELKASMAATTDIITELVLYSSPGVTFAAASKLHKLCSLSDAHQLHGEKASRPLEPGQMIVARCRFEDTSETDMGAFMVLRSAKSSKTYLLAPFGTSFCLLTPSGMGIR